MLLEEMRTKHIYALIGILAIHKIDPDIKEAAPIQLFSDEEIHEKIKEFLNETPDETAKALYTRVVLADTEEELRAVQNECHEKVKHIFEALGFRGS